MWDDDYITIRYNSSTVQLQYYPKANKGWAWHDAGLLHSHGSNHTVKGDSGDASSGDNQWFYFLDNGTIDTQYNFKNYATQVLGFVIKERFSSGVPAYLIHAVCGRATDYSGGVTSFAVEIKRLVN